MGIVGGGSQTVSRLRLRMALSAAALVLVVGTQGIRAEEIEKKFRIGFSIGSQSTTDQLHSPSANRRTLIEPNGEPFDAIFDPRNDSSAISDFGIETQYGGVLSASYAFTRNWYVEGSAGYRRGDVGNVEVQAQFDGAPLPTLQRFGFRIFNLSGGTLTQIPVQFTAGYRFRPKAAFNPYVCAGIGYVFNSFSPSDEIDELSRNLSGAVGGFAAIDGTARQGESFSAPTEYKNLSGITVDAPDAPEWHAGGGFEFTVKSKWAIFVDARYTVFSGRFSMKVNGGDELGVSVPADQVLTTDPGAFGPFGAVLISTGGLLDGGSLVPTVSAPPGTDCAVTPANCELTGPKDGINDPGYYYVHAGTIRYDAASIQIGFKFTF